MPNYSTKNIPSGFYIYAYIRKDGTPYYIGKGKDLRAWYKSKKQIKVPKSSSQIIIMESNLTEVGALALERFYIRWYGRKDNGTGILRNMTDGGEGTTGIIRPPMSEERKEHIRIKNRMNPPRKGTTTTEIARKNIGDAKRGDKNPKYWMNKKRSEDTKNKISSSKKGTIQTEEHKQINSQKIKELWKDPVWRENMLKARRK